MLATVKDVTKSYRLGTQDVVALGGVSISVDAGEFMAIAGPSGSGKTTLLNLIGCLDTPTSGDIEIDGEAVGALSSSRRADLRARAGRRAGARARRRADGQPRQRDGQRHHRADAPAQSRAGHHVRLLDAR